MREYPATPMRELTFLIAGLLVLLIFSCGADELSKNGNVSDSASFSGFQQRLNDRELAYLGELQATGVIRYGVISTQESYYLSESGEYRGFDYVFAREFAEALGVSAQFSEQEQISDFFTRDGEFDNNVIGDPEISYVPDLMDEVDIYAAPFGINDWRRKLVSMVPFFPVGVVIIGPEASGIESYEDLDGLSVAVRPGDFQIPLLQSIMEEQNINVEFVKYTDAQETFNILRDGRADITIDGSLFLARTVQELDDMEVSQLTLSLVPVGWAVDPREEPLTALLEKFVAHSLENGDFASVWEREMGINFDYYLDLVSTQE